ncbi:type II toxin-antitoxin system RelE/ParE family toxin [Methylocystis sp. JR02]|uniref:type II toxin-antitoxin system RelE/ParE family toxin n=1 Tax=Methylocystis sp. JR02 TaxID=3046284 RepID=UPI0024BB3581|nr:type II toxin-antitoxin system RelE/ParE family toxin [Methylocystis sp. JR02]MDJ0449367.1 type II toxin-antitoxin system RelE/ParE family toxin [Methylocystis sp. JR02]
MAEDSPSAALRWFEGVHHTCQRLAEMPKMGVARLEIRPDLRVFASGNYPLAYREVDDGVEIMRVLHGAGKWQELL